MAAEGGRIDFTFPAPSNLHPAAGSSTAEKFDVSNIE